MLVIFPILSRPYSSSIFYLLAGKNQQNKKILKENLTKALGLDFLSGTFENF